MVKYIVLKGFRVCKLRELINLKISKITYKNRKIKFSNADVAELVDASAWGAGDLGRGGSSPPIRTTEFNYFTF